MAIVVPGNGRVDANRVYRISDCCRALVVEAGRLAVEHEPAVVVLTGWSPSSGPSEAAQMRDAWAGPPVELILEETARTTVENASRTLPLLLERGIDRAIVVVAPVHRFRARFFFTKLYRPRGIATTLVTARVALRPRAVIWELVALTVRRAQLRIARRELRR